MALFRRLAVLAGAAEAARRYARKNPDKAGQYLDQAASFVDKQTKGKYSEQIRGAADKARDAAGLRRSGGPGADPYGGGPNGAGQGFGQQPTQNFPADPRNPENPQNPQHRSET